MEWFTFFRGHPFPSHHPCHLNYGHPSRLNCGHPCHLNCGPPSHLIRGHPFPLELELGLEQVLLVHCRTLGFDHTVEAPHHNMGCQGCNHYWYTRIQNQSHLNCGHPSRLIRGHPFPSELELGLEQVLVAHFRTLGFDHKVEAPHHNKCCQGCNHYWYSRIQTQSHLNCGRPSRLIRGHPFPLELGLEQVQVVSTHCQYMEKSQDHNNGYQGSNHQGYTQIQTQSHLRKVGYHYMVGFRYHNKHCQDCNHYWYTQLELGLEQVQVESTHWQYMEKSQDHNKGYQGCNH